MPARITSESVERVCHLYGIGFSMEQIAARTGLHVHAVRNRLIKGDMQIRPRNHNNSGDQIARLPHAKIEHTVFLYTRLGLTLTEIAQIQDVFRTTVRYRLQKAGIPLRSQSESIALTWKRRKHGCETTWPFRKAIDSTPTTAVSPEQSSHRQDSR